MVKVKLLDKDQDNFLPDEDLHTSEYVRGRVWLYDDSTKILVLKLWDEDQKKFTSLGLYNVHNVKLTELEVDSPETQKALESDLLEQFGVSEENYNKINMDKK